MKITIAATSDIHYDQRVQKIAGSLSKASHTVLVIGRNKKKRNENVYPFRLNLLPCFFQKSFFFYAEYNLRLFWKLLFTKMDVICACDLDTLLACTLTAKIKGSKLVFDAHEYFENSIEIKDKPIIRYAWQTIAKICLPRVDLCYTVSQSLANILTQKYGKTFHLIRNVPLSNPRIEELKIPDRKILWYQGAVNEGRGLELLIDCIAMLPDYTLEIAGDGDVLEYLKQRVADLNLQQRILFHGRLNYDEMFRRASNAWIGFDLLDSKSDNYFYSLSNKTFDYMKAGLPIVQMNFPEYANIHNNHQIGVLINHLSKEQLLLAIKKLETLSLQTSCRQACIKASGEFTWEKEEEKMLELYNIKA
ncbi:MAG: glycosyltransferase [Saprospiraceae bacterium]|nr:glycosyltransferase [Saprospiraceae bacterium]